MTPRKMITVFLESGKTVSESQELVGLRKSGWKIDLIVPQGENGVGQLMVEVYLSQSESGVTK